MISVHIESGAVLLRRAALPKPKPGSALIRLRMGGICNTDIELLRGYYGFRGRPGHEFVGEVTGPAAKAIVSTQEFNIGVADPAHPQTNENRPELRLG